MKKIVWFVTGILLICSLGSAKELDAEYAVSFGVLGELGVSHAHFKSDDGVYTITINASATGMAKILSQNRIEKHSSEGFVKEGRLYAKIYRVMIAYGDKRKEKVYRLDYQKKSITKTILKYKKDALVAQSSEILSFFGSDDLLTLYFNLPLLMEQHPKPGNYRFKAAGAEQQEGSVDVTIPSKEMLSVYENILGKGDFRYLRAVIYQKIFNSNKGELLIAIGKEGIAQKAVLKDLILFGDLVMQRIK